MADAILPTELNDVQDTVGISFEAFLIVGVKVLLSQHRLTLARPRAVVSSQPAQSEPSE
eukprot:m.352998 g.352998  ORF g.352998 m.352998 type:complete len:59 (+) comp55918_c0_seq14:1059-1235(+)